ncbi:MAG TPA: hypothetical protein VHC43_15695 [Mycobacteriales bacterium]|nr:hypothetical protein [Mycobacteriales bacterium]
MIWMAWRQLRTSAAVVGLALVALLVTLAVTGVHLNHEYSAYRACRDIGCDGLLAQLQQSYPHVMLIGVLLLAGPAVLGIFWGAPLVGREMESGTYRLAWTQGVSRTRWISTRVLVGALTVLVTSGLLAFAFSWWSKPFDLTGTTRIDPTNFAQRGVVPVAYALFAFGLGVAAGALVRRTLAAMAVTLVGFVGIRMIVQYLVRPHLMTPLTKVVALGPRMPLSFKRTLGGGLQLLPGHDISLPHAWTLGTTLADASGHPPSSAFLNHACTGLLHIPPPSHALSGRGGVPPAQVMAAMQTCVQNVSARYHLLVSYQPGSRFWAFQWIESGIFVGLAVALLGIAVYWVRRRLV